MKKLGPNIDLVLGAVTGDRDQMRINLRAHQVRNRYKTVLETVYRDTAPLFLQHTNNVYIMNKEGVKTLIVYVDESIFAAELNAQRELIKLKLLELYGEQIEQFEIYVSRGKYRNNHPYVDEAQEEKVSTYVPEPLSTSELEYVENTVSTIEDNQLKKALEKAMTASMELNKTENGKSS